LMASSGAVVQRALRVKLKKRGNEIWLACVAFTFS
jgi:hypothetical protein